MSRAVAAIVNTVGACRRSSGWAIDGSAGPPWSVTEISVRLAARFVDPSADEEMVEEHQITLWPAPPGPEIRWKLTDQVGAEIRAEG
ncbi:hypothetical protein [Actinoallomurus sp. CA-150999]|uniref:hypothetical protein n=1 Tax=Actinoallomurus sp. CA-150999 TaxID=3239887 RepID=UPI003D93BBB1